MREFVKMHGLGNDFVILDTRPSGTLPPVGEIVRLADRRRGVGCDQVVFLLPSTGSAADIRMRFFNADGTEAEACGNATRCVADLILTESGRDRALIETVAGILPVWRAPMEHGMPMIAVDLACPIWGWEQIPLAHPQDTLKLDLTVGQLSEPVAVNVGNPHVVFFVPDVDVVDLATVGPQIERHPLFPQRINVEICHVINRQQLRMRVWERGAGITQACGSGAAATLVAAARRGYTERDVEVLLDGGTLRITWRPDGRVVLTGPVAQVYAGTLTDQFSEAS